jgi:KDO2-lipid IV(A) lauroyltransferase
VPERVPDEVTATTSAQQRAAALALGACAALPLPLARALGRGLGRLAGLAGLREARTTRQNLDLCFPHEPPSVRARLARRSLAETGALATELGLAWCRPPAAALSTVREVRGAELLEDAARARRGVLLLAPHQGNWEVLNLWLAARGPFLALYEPARDAALDAWIRTRRERSGARLVPTDAGGIRELLRALRGGATVGILPDQVPPRSGGVHVPFFDQPALTMTLVPRLLRATGAAAVVGVAERIPGGFRIVVEPAPPGLDDADPRRAARTLNEAVETVVRRSPAQYQWDYKRFKRPPAGHPAPYRRP